VIFEWDEAKNESNFRKHGIRFDNAVQVFDDPDCLIEKTYSDPRTGEQRWKATGLVPTFGSKELVVIHVYRANEWETPEIGEEPQEVVRIISARKAHSSESRRYQGA